MKQPVGVILSAILQILGSLLILLLSITTFLLPALIRRAPEPPTTPMPPALFAGLGAFYGVLAILGLLTAIGLFRLKRWSRYSTLVFAGVLVNMGLFLAIAFALMPFPTGDSALHEAAITRIRVVMAAISLAIAALGGVWLYYFNRRNVREAFFQGDAGSLHSKSGILIGGRKVPFSIAFIGGYSLFAAICTLASMVWFPSALVIGFFLTGKSAIPFMLFFSALYAYIGVSLLKLWKSGRTVGILFNCYWLINGVIFALMPAERFARISTKVAEASTTPWPTMNTSEATLQSLLPMMRLTMIDGVVTSLVILYFLVTRKSAFHSEAAV
ncbi:MAG TPA: hypothetical protein VIH91_04985 [Terriglobales bacterium]